MLCGRNGEYVRRLLSGLSCAMSDYRRARRQRTLKAGRIVFNQKSSVFDCTVRNLSRTGACLDVPSSIGIPAAFELVIEAVGTALSCRVVWRSDRRIGVQFSTESLG
jgi:hypothetical protein